jgi:hypothetical protein
VLALKSKVQNIINDFADQLTATVRQAVIDEILGAVPGRSSSEKRAAARPQGARRAKGEKRPAKEIAETVETLLSYIKKHPGERIEQIATGLKTSTRELHLPTKKLIATKKVTARGQKRATRYFPR